MDLPLPGAMARRQLHGVAQRVPQHAQPVIAVTSPVVVLIEKDQERL
jgi:hypothetical protein